MKKPLLCLGFMLGAFGLIVSETIDLSGTWNTALPSGTYEIQLPGTTDLAGIGEADTLAPALTKPQLLRLTRRHSFIGEAAYSRYIDVPKKLAGKPLELKLERVMWKSRMVVDGDTLPEFQESLATPHRFRLPEGLSAGRHDITLLIDNSEQHDISVNQLCHAYTNDTQVKWNGVLGEMSLRVVPEIDIRAIEVYPSADGKQLKVITLIDNNSKKSRKTTLELSAAGASSKEKLSLKPGLNRIERQVLIDQPLEQWGEFSRRLMS